MTIVRHIRRRDSIMRPPTGGTARPDRGASFVARGDSPARPATKRVTTKKTKVANDGRPFTRAELAAILAAWNASRPARLIAADHGRTEKSITDQARRRGWAMRRTNGSVYTAEEIESFSREWEQGDEAADLAAKYGDTRQAMTALARKLRVRRPAHWARGHPPKHPRRESVPARRKIRACLCCNNNFASEGAGDRVCPSCEATPKWKQGYSLGDAGVTRYHGPKGGAG